MNASLREDFVGVDEAARLLGVSASTIWRWIDRGELAPYRLGRRRVLLRRSDVARTIRPAADRPDRGSADENKRRALALLDRFEQWVALDRERRGDRPPDPIWKDINAARDERSQVVSGE